MKNQNNFKSKLWRIIVANLIKAFQLIVTGHSKGKIALKGFK